MRRWAMIFLVWVVGVAVGGMGTTLAAFSSATANGGNNFEAAASFCVNPGSQTLFADADAYVDQGSATSNFGGATTLVVRSGQTLLVLPNNARTLVRFPLPAIPSYCTLTGATLRLNASSAAAGRTLQVFRASASWSEGNVTWNSQPAATGTAVTAASGTGWVTWDALAHVEALYAGANEGFVVRDAQEGAGTTQTQTFSSREGSEPPELVLTFA